MAGPVYLEGAVWLSDLWLAVVMGVSSFFSLAFVIYHLLFIPFGLARFRQRRVAPPKKTFAIIIPAHNEEAVIGRLIENLQAMDYPRYLYDIYVVADNCSDATAAEAAARGATVLVRSDRTRCGKGHALQFAFDHLFGGYSYARYDAVVILDADNLISTSFLSAMNTRLCQGERLIQGYLDTKNPDDSWVSGSFAISYWVSNRFWCLARCRLGLAVPLGGTGMCIETSLLREVGWGTQTLTEDLEFAARALEHGVRATWAHEAPVYDEKPLSFLQSCRQRLRWVSGGIQVARLYAWRLLRLGLRRRSALLLEGALLLCRPFFVIVGMVPFMLLLLSGHADRADISLLKEVVANARFSGWGALWLLQYALPLVSLVLDRLPLRPYRFLLLYPLFVLSWLPVTIAGFLLANRLGWWHTPHSRSIAYRDLCRDRIPAACQDLRSRSTL